MIRRNRRAVIGLALVVLLCAPALAGRTEIRDKAVDSLAERTWESIDEARRFEGVENIAIAPLFDDDEGEVAEALKSSSADSKYNVIVRTDEEWKRLLDEIKWGDERQDVMDEATIQKFGNVQGVDAILYGRIRQPSYHFRDKVCEARADLKLAEVETGKILWGENVVGTGYAGGYTFLEEYGVQILVVLAILLVVIAIIGVFRRLLKPY